MPEAKCSIYKAPKSWVDKDICCQLIVDNDIRACSKLLQIANQIGHIRLALADFDNPVDVLLSVPSRNHFGEDGRSCLVVGALLLHCLQLVLEL